MAQKFNKQDLRMMIKEEVTNASSGFSFITDIDDNIDIFGFDKSSLFDVLGMDEQTNYELELKANVYWTMSLDTKTFGVENINTTVQNIIGVMNVSIWQEDGPDDVKKVNFNAEKMGFTIKSEINPKGSGIYPTFLDINFKDKTILVN